jgi:hypothetical protein
MTLAAIRRWRKRVRTSPVSEAWLILGLAVGACVALPPAHATQTENHGLHAVPAPRRVTIDGSLAEWDLSGQVLMCYDIETLRDLYSARIALMHNGGNLYVGIHWKSPRPMSNRHDPRYEADKAWAGDSIQLRLKTDRIAHLTAWYHAPKKEPAIQISYGKSLTEPFGGGETVLLQTRGAELTGGAAMAFRRDPDGKGYVQEIRLPWRLITRGKRYRAGDQFRCGVELLWGSTDWPEQRYADNLMPGQTSREFFWQAVNAWGPVFLEPRGRLRLPTPAYLRRALRPTAARGPVPIPYALPRAGLVTVAIDDARGRRVRNLVAALSRPTGRNVEYWDGRDDSGKPLPPGSYRSRFVVHDPIRVNWVLSFANPGNPTWNTPDGRGAFYADHTPPQAVAAGGDFVALACPMGEAGPPLIGCDLSGQKLWGQANRTAFDGGHISLATDGKTLWVASEGKRSLIYRNELATGRYAPWRRTAKDEQGRPYRILDLSVSDLPGVGSDPGLGVNMTAIAVRDGTLAVCLAREDRLKLLDAETGALRRAIPVEAPQSVVLDRDGSPLVLSRGRILRLGPDGSRSPFTPETYPDGYGLAMDGRGNVYLSVRGADQNVKVFSPGGRPLPEIGRRGGRPLNGPYDPQGMRNPAQLAVDRQHRLWVAEETDNPKRTSVWSWEGRLLKDLAGTTRYSSAGSLNPYDPTMAFSDDTVYRLDWSRGQRSARGHPVYSLHGSGEPDDLFPPRVHNLTSRVIQRGADLLVYTTDSAQGATEVHCTLYRGGRWRSAAHTGVVVRRPDGQYAKYMSPLFEGHEGKAYAWADRNADGRVQARELTFAPLQIGGKPAALQSYYWGQLPGPDGTIPYFHRETYSLVRLPVTGYTECGAPIYDVAHPVIVRVEGDLLGRGNGEGMLLGGSDGRVYLNQDPVLVVDRNGRVLGTYPSRFTSVHGSHQAGFARPGLVIGPSSIIGAVDLGGAAGEVFALNGNLGEHYLFTSDGLFVQSLFKDLRGGFQTPERAVRGMPFDSTTAGGESFGANLVRTKDGRVYLTIGATDARVLQVTGLETLRRLPDGRITYTPLQYQKVLRLAQESARRAAAPKRATFPRARHAPTIDGRPHDWPELLNENRSLIDIQESPQRRFARVQARYDERHLYLACRVLAAADRMRNVGQDHRLLFKTGDAVDLMLAPTTGTLPGHPLRLLMTVAQGRPTAILYQQTVPGTPKSARVPFSSPWRTITFDRVRPAPEVRLATGPLAGGYFLEAAIPWRLLGVQPRPGLKLRGDVGVLFADSGGTTTVSRRYWNNKATGLVNDVPGEAELTPSLWGTFVLQ